MRYFFPSKFRIRKRAEFVQIQRDGAKIYCKHFLIIVRPSKSGDSRLGVVVTRKLDKRAVRRNRLKRQLREIFRLNRSNLRSPLDIVIIARRGSLALKYWEIENEILGQLARKGYLKSDSEKDA